MDKVSNPFSEFLQSGRTPVILDGVDEALYHLQRQFVSKHALDIVHDCPAKFRLWQDGKLPEEEAPALRFGRALHCFTLQSLTDFRKQFAVTPDDITVRRGKKWEAFEADNKGKEILTAEEFGRITQMDLALGDNEKTLALIYEADGNSEQTVLFTHPHYGFPCKARIDRILPEAKLIVDLKTTANASPDAFTRAVINYRYHVQGAFYVDAMKIATGEDYDFAIVAIEKEPPFMVGVYLLTDWLELGRDEYKADFEALSRATESNDWHGYKVDGDKLPVPQWYARKFYQ